MSQGPFDEFRRLEKLIQKVLEAGYAKGASKGGVFIREGGGKMKIDIQGDVPNSTTRKLGRKYPNAEISTESKRGKASKPRDTVVEEVEEPETDEHPEEVDPGKLALKRFREKKKEGRHEDSSAEEGESK